MTQKARDGQRSLTTAWRQWKRLRNNFEFLAARYADFGYAKGCLIGNLAAEASANMPLVPWTMAESLAKWTQPLATATRSGQDGGSFVRGLDANQTARFSINSWEGAVVRMGDVEMEVKTIHYVD